MSEVLVAFLRARYMEARERENQKRRSIPSPFDGRDVEFRYSKGQQGEVFIDGRPFPADEYYAIATEPAPDPAAIADLDSKLAIVSEYEQAAQFYSAHPSAPAGEAHGLRTALRLLAQPHADHPDYRKEWQV